MKFIRMSIYIFSLCLVLFLFSSCKETDPVKPPVNEHDYATDVIITLLNQSNPQDTIISTWSDLDGPGGNSPTISDTLRLAKGKKYNGSITLYNKSKNPIENITNEIIELADEHQFFYTPSSTINSLIVSILDKDSKNLPIGLLFTIDSPISNQGIGLLNVVLSHYDDSPKDGFNRSAETDIEIDFPISLR